MDGSAGRWSRVALLGRANRTTFLPCNWKGHSAKSQRGIAKQTAEMTGAERTRTAIIIAVAAAAVLLCVGWMSTGRRGAGRPEGLMEFPMNAEAIGDNRLLSAKVQMAYGGLAALRRQVGAMDINWGNKPKHPGANFAEAYGKMDALEKLVSGMEQKDFNSANSVLADTPDETPQAIMQPETPVDDETQPSHTSADEDEVDGENVELGHKSLLDKSKDKQGEESQGREQSAQSREFVEGQQQGEDNVIAAQTAALRQRGDRVHGGLVAPRRGRRQRVPVVAPVAASAGFILPPAIGKSARHRASRQLGLDYDAAPRLSAADRRRLAHRAAVRMSAGVEPDQDAVVMPPWTR